MELVKYRDESGKIGVIYSPCYGMEWISFDDTKAHYAQLLMFDHVLVKAVLEEDNTVFKSRFDEIMKEYKVDEYYQSTEQLQVYFMKEGTVFETSVHDGYERIIELGSNYLIA